jgi:hypothetical protein
VLGEESARLVSRVGFGSAQDFDRILSDLVQVLIDEAVADEMPGGGLATPEHDVLDG